MSTARQKQREEIEQRLVTQTNQLVEIIRQETEGKSDKWKVITHRSIPETIEHVTTFSTKKLMELLKLHPNIIFEKVKGKSSKLSFQFRYVSKEEKEEYGVSAKNFGYLDQEHVDMIRERLRIDDYDMLYKYLSFINFLARDGATKKFVQIVPKHFEDLLDLTPSELVRMIDKLKDNRLIMDLPVTKDAYMLLLDEESVRIARQAIAADNKLDAVSDLSISEMEELEKIGMEFVKRPDIDEFVRDVTNNMKSFSLFIDDFKHYIDDKVEHILDTQNYIKQQEARLSASYQVASRLNDENKQKDDVIAALRNEIRVLRASNESLGKKYDQRLDYMQEQFGILIGETTHAIEEFSKLPAWQQNAGTRNKFEKKILDAVNYATSAVLEYKPE